MLIDANDEKLIQQSKILKDKLIAKKKEQGTYTSEDIVLVRVTDHLPINGVVPAISNVPFVHKMNDLSLEAIDTVIAEQGLNWDERKEEVYKYTPLSTQYRSSIHFCLNGIVSSHMQGNFDGNPFVIIDPFSEHENDDNILAVRGEDTYFSEKLKLSDKAIILVDERYKDKISESGVEGDLEVVYYRGDQKKATEAFLLSMGIIPETIGKDYIIESETSNLIYDFIDEKGYPEDKHCYSESYQEDDQKTLILWQKYAENFYSYLYTKVYGSTEGKREEIFRLSEASSFDQDAVSTLVEVIKTVGLDEYEKIVAEYNDAITKKVETGQYPNNNQILAGAPLESPVKTTTQKGEIK